MASLPPVAAVAPVATARPAPGKVPPPPPPAQNPAAGVPNLEAEQLVDLEMRTARLDEFDYFEMLKLEKSAAPGDIKKAFYRESRAYHPDRFFHLSNPELKARVSELYKRVTEAYYVLRDDTKRKKYLADISGPERASKLRFTDASEADAKAAAKKEAEEQVGTHPKGRQFYATGLQDLNAGRWSTAERNFKMALTYEPSNARYKEKLKEASDKILQESREKGDGFRIK